MGCQSSIAPLSIADALRKEHSKRVDGCIVAAESIDVFRQSRCSVRRLLHKLYPAEGLSVLTWINRLMRAVKSTFGQIDPGGGAREPNL
jgi:hypothetical protein